MLTEGDISQKTDKLISFVNFLRKNKEKHKK